MVAESFIGIYGFGTGEVVTEGAPLPRPDPNTGVGAGRAAMRSLEEQVLGAEGIEGIVLRYGAFYGPGVGTTEA
jgi:2-alkyl-3-oxoalkanoate reductase